MSMGTKSLVYKPVEASMLPAIERSYPRLPLGFVKNVFDILTKNLRTETLLFICVVDMLARFLDGEREGQKRDLAISTQLILSALRKDRKGKMQTDNMELIHDVVVELQMAGGNFRDLNRYLAGFGLKIVFGHSCKSAVVRAEDEDLFYSLFGEEQLLRTELDWSGPTTKSAPIDVVIRDCEYSEYSALVAERCYNFALELVRASSSQSLDISSKDAASFIQ